jgi:hypothetical protein
MDHLIHTYHVYAPIHHDCYKLPKLSTMGERPL